MAMPPARAPSHADQSPLQLPSWRSVCVRHSGAVSAVASPSLFVQYVALLLLGGLMMPAIWPLEARM